MIGQLRDGDVVVVWKLDRLSRSLKDMLEIMERIEIAGSGFRSLTKAIDTTTAAGRMMMQMVGSFAEFERAMIRERTCGSAWKRDPGSGVIGVEKGPLIPVVEAPQLASRLKFDCRPIGRFLDLPVNGRHVTFYENVFYRFDRGRIVQVWSIVDKAAIEAQLQERGGA